MKSIVSESFSNHKLKAVQDTYVASKKCAYITTLVRSYTTSWHTQQMSKPLRRVVMIFSKKFQTRWQSWVRKCFQKIGKARVWNYTPQINYHGISCKNQRYIYKRCPTRPKNKTQEIGTHGHKNIAKKYTRPSCWVLGEK